MSSFLKDKERRIAKKAQILFDSFYKDDDDDDDDDIDCVKAETNSIQEVLKELGDLRKDIQNERESNKRVLNKLEEHQEKNKSIILRLTQEVVTLTEEFREFKKNATLALSGTLLEEENLLPDFPIYTPTVLSEFDQVLLDNPEARSQLKNMFVRCGRESAPEFLRYNIRKVLSDELSMQYTWNGTKEKPSIKAHSLISILKEICLQMFTSFSEQTTVQVIKQHFLHAADRVKKKNRNARTSDIQAPSTSPEPFEIVALTDLN